MEIQYATLNTYQFEIRLLTVGPGKAADELRCSLSVVSLNTNPKYEALSYVWGDPSITANITVDGTSHPVTANLKYALCALRGLSKPRIIWVDAICINREDLVEKNNQIPLMARIYSAAFNVVVSLGPGSPSLDYFAQWADAHHSKRPFSFRWIQRNVLPGLTPTARAQKRIRDAKFLRSEMSFWKHQYFRRMWTVQELALAHKPPIVFIGQKSVLLTRANDEWVSLLENCESAYAKVSESRFVRLRSKEEFKNILEQVHAMMDPPALRESTITASPHLVQIFPMQLSSTAHRDCFDPRDRIFALYPLFPELQAVCPADYRKPPEQVLMDTLTYILEHHPMFFSVIHTWPLRPHRLEDESYPTWLPDITGRQPAGVTGSGFYEGARHVRSRPVIDNNILFVDAWMVGKCKVVLRFEDSAARNLDTMFQYLDGVMEASLEYESWGIRELDGTKIHRRIAYACYYHDHVGPPEFPEEEYHQIQAEVEARGAENLPWQRLPKSLQILRDKAERLAGKVLFVTRSGLFGICSDLIEDGDYLFVSPSLYQPMPLRIRGEYCDGNDRRYARLVDFAFVDGLIGDSKHDAVLKFVESQKLTRLRIG
ncbi:unnamed protein product [Clonostachys solani]|uniref:Heterokaryon incompatibility domain-containing protein n=1 Tax=Clonostachys solani TaxID=160281 RepID=A0A9N9YYA4_9HYPO|nr:unnamed protein product [Clonostachys solani]